MSDYAAFKHQLIEEGENRVPSIFTVLNIKERKQKHWTLMSDSGGEGEKICGILLVFERARMARGLREAVVEGATSGAGHVRGDAVVGARVAHDFAEDLVAHRFSRLEYAAAVADGAALAQADDVVGAAPRRHVGLAGPVAAQKSSIA